MEKNTVSIGAKEVCGFSTSFQETIYNIFIKMIQISENLSITVCAI